MEQQKEKQRKYNALHMWVNRNKPKVDRCESCGKIKKLDAANISGEYKRDIDDYAWLCRQCHFLQDERHEKLSKAKEKRVIDNLGNIYKSLTEASVKTGISITAISNCLTGRPKTAGRREWRYA